MKGRILFVDDSPVIKKIIKRAIEAIEYELIDASDGKEALSILNKDATGIKLILTDWNMPVMNGFELLKAIKSSAALKQIPVIMLTTEAEKGNINKAVQAGAANYLLKPFNTDDLVKKVTQCIG